MRPPVPETMINSFKGGRIKYKWICYIPPALPLHIRGHYMKFAWTDPTTDCGRICFRGGVSLTVNGNLAWEISSPVISPQEISQSKKFAARNFRRLEFRRTKISPHGNFANWKFHHAFKYIKKLKNKVFCLNIELCQTELECAGFCI